MQDTFLKLYADFDRLRQRKVSSWLVKTAKNAALNYVKKHKREILTDDNTTLHREDRIEDSAEENCLKNDLGMQKAELHKRILDGLMEKESEVVRRDHSRLLHGYSAGGSRGDARDQTEMYFTVCSTERNTGFQKTYGAEYEEMK